MGDAGEGVGGEGATVECEEVGLELWAERGCQEREVGRGRAEELAQEDGGVHWSDGL